MYTKEIELRYGEIDLPVLLIWGEKDEWIPIEKGAALQSQIPGAILQTIPEAGHLVQEDEPAVLLQQIFRFLHSVKR
ncbi:alpha/beta fold hydrolase [Saccharibacillus kuerlensis]